MSARAFLSNITIILAVMGVGATKRASAVRWSVARDIVSGWVLTLPAAALTAALVYLPLHLSWT